NPRLGGRRHGGGRHGHRRDLGPVSGPRKGGYPGSAAVRGGGGPGERASPGRRRLRSLIDDALSPRLAECLRERGVDAVHVRELDMACASDSTILTKAVDERRR